MVNTLVRAVSMLHELSESFWLCVANWLPRLRCMDRLRAAPLRLAGMRVGRGVRIWSGINLSPIGYASNLHIGRGTFINVNLRCAVPRQGLVVIGENCAIGPNVAFECFHHNLAWSPDKGWGGQAEPIKVEDRVWIGARSIILGGVTIGQGSVIAAGAVVTRDVAPYTLVGGVPARAIRQLYPEVTLEKTVA